MAQSFAAGVALLLTVVTRFPLMGGFAHCGFKVVDIDDVGLVPCVLGGAFSGLLMALRAGGSIFCGFYRWALVAFLTLRSRFVG